MSTPTFLRGADAYLQSAQQKNKRATTYAERLIERADAVSIFDVLEDWFGTSLPRTGQSYKSPCPFAFEHADRGLDKGFRTYPATNSAMCFPMHGFLTSTRLISIKYQERQVKAAERILRNYDMLSPKPWRERYDELAVEVEQKHESIGNPQNAVEALNIALSAVPGYQFRQFDTDVMTAMETVLEKLNEVTASGDPERVRKWYQVAKNLMLNVVEGNTP